MLCHLCMFPFMTEKWYTGYTKIENFYQVTLKIGNLENLCHYLHFVSENKHWLKLFSTLIKNLNIMY